VTEPSVRAALCCHLANATDLLTPASELLPVGGSKLRSYFAVCGPKFTRLCQQTRERSYFATPFSDCAIPCFVPEIFAIEVRRRPKSRLKSMFFRPQIFLRENPQMLDLVFKIAPISDHVAKFRGDRPRDRGELALNKKTRKRGRAQRKGHSFYVARPLPWQHRKSIFSVA